MSETDDPTAEVAELVSALVDEQVSEEQMRRLRELLLADSEARRVYLMCMRMHADLQYLHGGACFQGLSDVTEAHESPKSSNPRMPAIDLPLASSVVPSEGFAS